MPSNITNGKTLAQPYVFDPFPTDPNNYNIIPLITVGDEAPLLQGTFPNLTTSPTETFAMAGIPDGLGYVEIGGFKYVFMNHELSGNTIDPVTGVETSPPTTTATNSVGNEIINGARVSLWQFDQNWNLLGGKNLIEDVLLDGVTYSLNTLTGNYEDPLGNVLTFFNHENFTRFCSGYLAAQGFVDPATGQPIPIWFAPQERPDGVGTPVQANGLATPIRGLGTLSKENIIAASQYRADNSEFTVLITGEDNSDGELYMYVGRQTPGNPNGFWGSVADGANFQLYVLRVKDQQGNVFGYETMPENVPLVSEWVAVPDDVAVAPDPDILTDFVNSGPNIEPDPTTGAIPATNVLTALDVAPNTFNSTNFRRIEDAAEDPNNQGTFYFVTTGRNDEVPVNGYSQPNPLAGLDNPPQGPTTARDNPLGKLHRLTVAIDPVTGAPLPGTFETLLEGGQSKGVSYDNIIVDSNGNVLIQEDETADGDVIFAVENRDGSILSYNIAANEGIVGTDVVDFLFEIDSTAANTAAIDFSEIGGWETSGIIEIDPLSAPGQSSYLFDVQASTISTDDTRLRETQTYQDLIAAGNTDAAALDILRPAALEVLGGQYERGGQLLLAEPVNATNPTPVNPPTTPPVNPPTTPPVNPPTTPPNPVLVPTDPAIPGAGVNVVQVTTIINQNESTAFYYEVPAGPDVNVKLSNNVDILGTEAAFVNIVGFYEVIDINGTISDGGVNLAPGDVDYARVAIENRIDLWEFQAGGGRNTTIEQFGNVVVTGGRFYAPFVIANGGVLSAITNDVFQAFIDAEDLELDGVFNDAADFFDDVVAYFGFEAANPDGQAHLQARGNNTFAFEDLPYNLPGFTPDGDFNDAVFAFNFDPVV